MTSDHVICQYRNLWDHFFWCFWNFLQGFFWNLESCFACSLLGWILSYQNQPMVYRRFFCGYVPCGYGCQYPQLHDPGTSDRRKPFTTSLMKLTLYLCSRQGRYQFHGWNEFIFRSTTNWTQICLVAPKLAELQFEWIGTSSADGTTVSPSKLAGFSKWREMWPNWHTM